MNYPEAIKVLRQHAIVLDGLSTPAWDSITKEYAADCQANAIKIRAAISFLESAGAAIAKEVNHD